MASTIPPPPPPPTAPETRVWTAPPEHVHRAGELSDGWNVVFWLAWTCVAASFIAVWVSSRTTGLSTWWLGPEASPRPVLLNLLPFVIPIGLAIAGLTRRRWLPWFGMAGAVLLALIGVGDIDRVEGYAFIEIGVAGGAFLVSAACLAGLLRAGDE